MRTLLLALLLLAAPLAGCVSEPAPSPDTPAPPDEGGALAPPAWRFVDTDGQEHSNATAAGSPAVLFFFATWCSSCRQLTGELAKLHEDYPDAGIYSVSFDPSESDGDFEDWKQRYDQPWPHGKDTDSSIARTFGVRSQSSVVILGPDGHVAQGWGYGQADYEAMAATLDQLANA